MSTPLCKLPAGMRWVLAQVGLDEAALLRRAQLPPDTFARPARRLTVDQYFGLWRSLEALAGDITIGARMAALYPDALLEPALLVCMGSRDLGEALDRMARYKGALTPEVLHLAAQGDSVSLRYGWGGAIGPPPPVLIEAEFSFLLHMARKATGRALGPVHARLPRVDGATGPLEDALGARVTLGADEGTLTLQARALELPFLTETPEFAAALEARLGETAAGSGPGVGPTSAAVRQTLSRQLGGGQSTLDEAARSLGMSPRSLQRRLREERTSFGQLLSDVRRELATFLLRESHMSIAEIAFLLGYDLTRSFSRAFAGWVGVAPAAYRDLAR